MQKPFELPPPPFEPVDDGQEDRRQEQDERMVTAHRQAMAQAAVVELAGRRMEALRLYEPLPVQEEFHRSLAMERLVRGSNRGGKTLPAAVEVARAVTGQDPCGKYPNEGGRAFLVGKDGRHLGEVMWRKLGRAGAFKIIRDQETRQWRAFRPSSEADKWREKEARPAPPLIPNRFIKEIAWENKAAGIPSVVRLHNGWELCFFSSLGKPPQGVDIDLCWMDEEIVDRAWYPEMSARLLDRAGRLIWSATPQSATEQMYELYERCDRQASEETPNAREFLILLSDNPHISDDQKRLFAEKMSDPDEYEVRIGGEFALLQYKVYPEFSRHIHVVPYQDIPREWSRYMVVDPGHQVCAVLFAAVPSREEGDWLYIYDELYIKNCDANTFARKVAEKTAGQHFQAFVIDYHFGIHTEAGAGRTISQQYADALKERRVFSAATGNGFIYGSGDVEAGILAVHDLLRVRENGTPKLRLVKDKTPNLIWEIERYHKQRQGGIVIDKPNQRKNNHAMDALRYLAMFNPGYVKPRLGKAAAGGAVAVLREKKKRKKEAAGGSYVRLGPGSAR